MIVEDLDTIVDTRLGQGLSGLALGIVRDGRVVHERYAGMADVARTVPLTDTTRFRIGSVTKTMTAVAVLQLVDERLVDLDDKANEHLRGVVITVPRGSRDVTVRDLLTHLSGLGEVRRASDLLRAPYAGAFVRGGRRIPTLTEYYARGLRTVVPPGEKWYYSNHGYALLGKLVEDVTDTPLGDRFATKIFAPLGMSSTSLEVAQRPDPHLATGYTLRRGRLREASWIDPIVYPAGSVHSTLPDMLRYAAAISGDLSLLLSPAAARELRTEQWRPDPRLPGMALGLFREELDGRSLLSHGGAIPGFCSHLVVAPQDGVGVVALANTFTPVVDDVARAAARAVLPAPPRAATPLVAHDARHGSVDGTYRLGRGYATNLRGYISFGGRIWIRERPDGLHVRGRLGPLRKGAVLKESDRACGLYGGTVRLQGAEVPILLAVRRGPGAREPEVVLRLSSFFQLRRRSRRNPTD